MPEMTNGEGAGIKKSTRLAKAILGKDDAELAKVALAWLDPEEFSPLELFAEGFRAGKLASDDVYMAKKGGVCFFFQGELDDILAEVKGIPEVADADESPLLF
jgi:hypothetical protein